MKNFEVIYMKTIMDLTTNERKVIEARAAQIHTNDPAGFQKAMDLIGVLGLGGLWKGVEAAIVVAYEFEHDSDMEEHAEDAITIIIAKQVAPRGVLE